MAKIRKLFLGMGAASLSVIPMVAVSCGQETTSKDKRIATQKQWANHSFITTINKDESLVYSKDVEDKNLTYAVLTDDGKITDKSFNQSSWEALLNIAIKLKIPRVTDQ